MRAIGVIWAVAVTLFYSAAALADGKVCNNTCSSSIFTTYGEQYSNSNQSWVGGWWPVQPGQCTSIIIGDVCNWWANVFGNCPNAVVMFANDATGDTWGGSLPICTTNNAFNEQPQSGPSCPAGQSVQSWFQFNYSKPSDDVTINLPPP